MGWRELVPLVLFAFAGLGLALWLSAHRVPPTPRAPDGHAAPSAPSMPSARPLPAMDAAPQPPHVDVGANGLPCGPTLSADASEEPGLVELVLFAPCSGGEVASVEHGPVRFDEVLPGNGVGVWTVPALDDSAAFAVRIAGTLLEAASPVVPGDRIVSGLAWEGALAPSLSVLEFGATRGGAGHVAAGVPGDGFVMGLGNYPGGAGTALYVGPESSAPGRVRLEVDTELNDETCGREWSLVAFTIRPGGLEKRDIRLTLGPCDGVVRSLRLKNLLGDLTLAGR